MRARSTGSIDNDNPCTAAAWDKTAAGLKKSADGYQAILDKEKQKPEVKESSLAKTLKRIVKEEKND